jgi:O-antigen ligase
MDWGVLGYLASAAVGAAFASDIGSALLELKMIFALPALFYLLLRVTGPDRHSTRRIVAGWALGAALVGLIGLAQYVLRIRVVLAEGGLNRLRSIYYSPNSVALYLGRVWPMLVAGTILGRGRRARRTAGICLAVTTFALVLSFSRGALLIGIPAAILLMGVWAGGRYRWAAVALVAAGALALIPLMTVPRFGSLLDVGRGSTFFRLELWRGTIAMIRDHPVLGVGPGQFAEAYRTRYILPAAWSEPTLTHPHNIVLDHWTRLGIAGLAAGIAVQWAFWRTVWSRGRGSDRRGLRRDALMIGLGGSMVVLLAHGLVDNTIFSQDMAMAFSLTLGVAHASAASSSGGASPGE